MKIKYWIKAARLRTLPLAFSCILISASLALINKIEFSFTVFSLLIATTLSLQILSNFANDYGDAIKGSDEIRTGEERMVQAGKISIKAMKIAIVLFSLISLLIGLLLILKVFKEKEIFKILVFLILGIISIIAAIKYTVGKSAYGYKAFGDLAVFLFFGIIGVMGSYYLLTQSYHWKTIPAALFTGCLSCGVLNLNNLRDFENDRINKKTTLVVKIGVENAKNYHFGLLVTSFISFLLLLKNTTLLYVLSAIPLIILFKHLYFMRNEKDLKKLDGQLKVVALTCFLSSLLCFIVGLFYSFCS